MAAKPRIRHLVISTIDTLFPRPFIRKVRLGVDKWTMPKKAERRIPLTEAELELAERRLGADRDWVDALFAQHPIQLGDGRPFPLDAPLHPEAERVVAPAG